jgi:hypothetical protein
VGVRPEDLKRKEELFAKKRALQSLLESPGWGLFLDALDRVILARRLQVFGEPLDSLDSIVRLVRTKGEVGGLMVSKEIPRAILNDIEADLAVLLEEA